MREVSSMTTVVLYGLACGFVPFVVADVCWLNVVLGAWFQFGLL